MISLERARAALQWPPERDDELRRRLDSVTALFESMTGRIWQAREDFTIRRMIPDGHVSFWLPLVPLEHVALVEWEPWEGRTDAVAVSPKDFEIHGMTGKVTRVRGRWMHNVEALASGGYGEDRAPGDILHAIELQLAFDSVRHSPELVALSSRSVGRGSVGLLDSGLHPVFEQTVARYSRDF